jgi:hypothetical protein
MTNGCASSNCLTYDFKKYDDTTEKTCAGSCDNRSCVKSGDCQATSACEGSNIFCHLCKDRECKQCSNYDECDDGFCTASNNAKSTTGGTACEC